MIRINLLPHRELKRQARRRLFAVLCVISAVIGGAVVGAGGVFINGEISEQKSSNAYIKKENDKLEADIKEIAKLRDEIEGLKARQKAVEDLQGDRNLPVHVLDELVKNTPEGIYLRSLRQQGTRVTLNGLAANNAKVADYVRNLGNNSPWLVNPELVEIKAVTVGSGAAAKRLNDFTMAVSIRRPKEPDAAAPAAPGAPGTPPAAAPGAPKA
ncbi:MAG TPA: PilN domain-containing protein [Burkholderiales bacterium]|jgi:type IV pilus assembly protein PilN|nr:PilN domain-containing protein [Burkholderiales bacterium]